MRLQFARLLQQSFSLRLGRKHSAHPKATVSLLVLLEKPADKLDYNDEEMHENNKIPVPARKYQ